MIVAAYRYNQDQPQWMNVISRAWSRKTDASMKLQQDMLYEWRLGSIKLMVEYDLLVQEAKDAGLIGNDPRSETYGKVIPGYDGQGE